MLPQSHCHVIFMLSTHLKLQMTSFQHVVALGGAWQALLGACISGTVAFTQRSSTRRDTRVGSILTRGKKNASATKVRSGSRNYATFILHTREPFTWLPIVYQTIKSRFKAFIIRWLLTTISVINLYERSTVHAFERMSTAIKIFIVVYDSASSWVLIERI